MIFELKDASKAEAFFTEHKDSLIWTCLQGLMGGKVYVTDTVSPRSAMAFIAEYAFLGGEPDRELAAFKPGAAVAMVPQNGRWAALIEEVWPGAYRETRYAIKKDTRFDRGRLEAIVASLPAGYCIKRLDSALYDACLESEQFEDSVMHFESKEQFLDMGRGFAVMKDGRPVSVASSYTVYRGGLEVQIATEETERHRGLASAAGAALILSCLDDGLYPSWDAANRGSLRLAQRLGYELDREYTAYWLSDE